MYSGARATLSRLLAAVAIIVIAALPAVCQSTGTTYPTYTAQSIVHAATQTVEALAPNTIATIYGSNMAFSTEAVATSNLVGGNLPQSLGGVAVLVNGWIANLFYVSPTQINFLVPYPLTAGPVNVVVTRQGAAGPVIPIQLNATAPGMFVSNGFVVATHLNGVLISPAAPAAGGEIIVVYVAGLGRVTPDTTAGRIATSAASIAAASQLQVLLAGTACPAANILYAGLAPGFAGLYQINLVLPPFTASNPEIRISVGPQISPPAVQLATQPAAAQ